MNTKNNFIATPGVKVLDSFVNEELLTDWVIYRLQNRPGINYITGTELGWNLNWEIIRQEDGYHVIAMRAELNEEDTNSLEQIMQQPQ